MSNEFLEPNFELKPRDDVVNEGKSVVLECLVNGWPKPDVRWLKGSDTISVTEDRVSIVIVALFL